MRATAPARGPRPRPARRPPQRRPPGGGSSTGAATEADERYSPGAPRPTTPRRRPPPPRHPLSQRPLTPPPRSRQPDTAADVVETVPAAAAAAAPSSRDGRHQPCPCGSRCRRRQRPAPVKASPRSPRRRAPAAAGLLDALAGLGLLPSGAPVAATPALAAFTGQLADPPARRRGRRIAGCGRTAGPEAARPTDQRGHRRPGRPFPAGDPGRLHRQHRRRRLVLPDPSRRHRRRPGRDLAAARLRRHQHLLLGAGHRTGAADQQHRGRADAVVDPVHLLRRLPQRATPPSRPPPRRSSIPTAPSWSTAPSAAGYTGDRQRCWAGSSWPGTPPAAGSPSRSAADYVTEGNAVQDAELRRRGDVRRRLQRRLRRHASPSRSRRSPTRASRSTRSPRPPRSGTLFGATTNQLLAACGPASSRRRARRRLARRLHARASTRSSTPCCSWSPGGARPATPPPSTP